MHRNYKRKSPSTATKFKAPMPAFSRVCNRPSNASSTTASGPTCNSRKTSESPAISTSPSRNTTKTTMFSPATRSFRPTDPFITRLTPPPYIIIRMPTSIFSFRSSTNSNSTKKSLTINSLRLSPTMLSSSSGSTSIPLPRWVVKTFCNAV